MHFWYPFRVLHALTVAKSWFKLHSVTKVACNRLSHGTAEPDISKYGTEDANWTNLVQDRDCCEDVNEHPSSKKDERFLANLDDTLSAMLRGVPSAINGHD
jgi:hypothetical protein